MLFFDVAKPPEKPSLLTTSWGQSGPHTYDYDGDNDGKLERYVPGCSAVAVGQLINYYLKQGCREGWLEWMLQDVTVYPRFCEKALGPIGFLCTKRTQELPGFPTRTDYVDRIESVESPGAPRLKRFLWNVAIGLDSQFVQNSMAGAGGRYWTEAPRSSDKLIELLRDRFRFKDGMTTSAWLTRLDEERDYIKNSIDNRQPVLMSVRLTKNGVGGGHLVLIDSYRESPTEGFQAKINWGWQNVDAENDRFFSSGGPLGFSMTVKGVTIDWVVSSFKIYKNTVPINY